MKQVINQIQHCSRQVYISILICIVLVSVLSLCPYVAPYTSWLSPPICLFLGLLYALVCKPYYKDFNRTVSKRLLQYSVIGLGFGMNLESALASGREGMMFTIVSVLGVMLLGYLIGRKSLAVDSKTSYLISAGTAICGGSAIAAVGPVIKARDEEMSVSLGIVFLLNALALFIFPSIGRWIGLSESEFGLWSAIAIHDTSSVVGAAASYGEEALHIATTIKLTRALWIIPLAFVSSCLYKGKGEKVAVPWFIVLFVLAMTLNTYVLDNCPSIGFWIARIARKALSITMFFIGASLSLETLKGLGWRPLLQAVFLWLLISLATVLYILL